MLGGRAGSPRGHLTPRVHAIFDYADAPLRLGTGEDIVARQGFLHVGASLTVADRLMFSLSLPFALLQDGDDPVVSGVTLESPHSAELGDLRLGGRRPRLGGGVAPGPHARGGDVYRRPAGAASFAGEGAVRGQPHLSLGGHVPGKVGFVWSASTGVMLRASDNPHLFTYGAGAALTFADAMVQVGPELYGATQLGDGDALESPAVTVQAQSRTNLELLGGAKVRVLDGLTFGAGAGPGLSPAIGTPTFRALGLVAWAPIPKPAAPKADKDADGITDELDACPDKAGVESDDPEKRGCPPPDRDGDGVADRVDACPGEKGRANADVTRNGCPADYDLDGIPDAVDACPNQKGIASADESRHGCPGEVDGDLDGVADRSDACPKVKGLPSEDPAKNGCPPDKDSDGDGIVDARDACPAQPGRPSPDRAQNGCPEKGKPAEPRPVAAGAVDLPRIFFEFGQAAPAAGATPDLERVLATLKSHPELKALEVQGHADEVGDPGYNQELSARRAQSVATWLVARGVSPARLAVKGYGSARPAASGTADDQRRQNRRVEVVVLEAR